MEDSSSSNSSQGEVQSVLGFWQQFDLANTKSSWDKACEEMREYKTSSINGRKRLNDLTKTFRSKSKDKQLLIFSDLLKAYQEEIDQLSRRSKFCEAAYGNIYKSLYEAPDPVPAIDQLINSVAGTTVQTLEIQRLKNELNQYEEEFKTLKNQEVTIRQLESMIEEYKENNEVKIQEEIEKQMNILREQSQQEILEQQSITKSMEKRVQQIQDMNKSLEQKNTQLQSELLTVTMTQEGKLSHLEHEKSNMADTIQRLQLQTIALENELVQWKGKQQQQGEGMTGSSLSPKPSGMALNAFKHNEDYEQLVQQYKEELTNQQETFLTEKFQLQESVQSLQDQLQQEKEKNRLLTTELGQCPKKADYLALRKRLLIVEQIAFHHDETSPSMSTSASSPSPNTNSNTRTGKPNSTMSAMDELGEEILNLNAPEHTSMVSLDILLTTKIKGLEKELVELRKTQFDSEQTLQQQKDSLQSNQELVQKQLNIIHKLEEELEKRNNTIDKIMQTMTAKKENTLTDLSDLLLGDSADLTNDYPMTSSSAKHTHLSTTSAVTNSPPLLTDPTPASISSSSSLGNQDQMILILQTQRDRYKEKLTLVEGNYLHVQEQFTALQQQHKQLQEENIALYRKIKFLQSYQSSRHSSSNHPSRAEYYHHTGHTPQKASRLSSGYDEESRYSDDVGVSGHHNNDIESKYAQLYESQMNPFVEFSSFEKQRKLSELSVADRIVLNTALAIISNNLGRNALLIYFAAMHVLVFFTIYYVSHNVHHGCDPSLDNLHHHLNAVAAATSAT